MSNGYSPAKKKKPGLQPIGASVSDVVISEFGLTAGGSKHLRVDVLVSGVTAATGITISLKHAVTSDGPFSVVSGTGASVAVTGDGVFSLTQLVERTDNQVNMPLRKTVQVVVSTGAGDAVTVDEVYISQPL